VPRWKPTPFYRNTIPHVGQRLGFRSRIGRFLRCRPEKGLEPLPLFAWFDWVVVAFLGPQRCLKALLRLLWCEVIVFGINVLAHDTYHTLKQQDARLSSSPAR